MTQTRLHGFMKKLWLSLAGIACLATPLSGHPWPLADYGAIAYTNVFDGPLNWGNQTGGDGSLNATTSVPGGLAMAQSAEAGMMLLRAAVSRSGNNQNAAARAEAYDSIEVQQGPTTHTVGSQVFLRITATLSGTLAVDHDYGSALGILIVECWRRLPPGHAWDARHPACRERFVVDPEEGGWWSERIDIGVGVPGNFNRTIDISKDLEFPVTVGETIIVRGVLTASCSALDVGGSCSADFQNTANIVVTPAPGFEGIEIRSAAQAAQAPADTTPPATVVTMPDANEHGWHNMDVAIALNATDDSGGSGVKEIVVRAEGAQPIPDTILPGASASVVIAAEGETRLTFFATDNAGNVEAPQTVTVRLDKTAPSFTACAATPDVLWPPNHKLAAVSASVSFQDALSGPGGIGFASATSTEPDEGLGDGDMPADIQALAAASVWLRAERSGNGPGREYRLTHVGSDLAGNTASCTAVVRVPHDRR